MAHEKKVEEKKAEEKAKKAPARPKAPKKAEPKAAAVPAKAPSAKAEEKPEAPKEAKPPEPKPPEEKPAAAPKQKKKKAEKKTRAFVARGKRKKSVARATIKAGKGLVRFNKMNVSSIPNSYIRDIITEPLRYIGPEANNVDLSVNVNGGGMMGQAQAARTAIANALVLYFDQMNLREKFISIDRSLVIEDTRRVESKKFRGPKARARFQKSYR